jgi:hypothetical protein
MYFRCSLHTASLNHRISQTEALLSQYLDDLAVNKDSRPVSLTQATLVSDAKK